VLFHQTSDERLIWNKVIPAFAQTQKIPVLKGLKSGHGKVNRPIPFLTKARLRTGRSPELEISLTPA
jgi:muramoyltetrapeptide carboxypeptidase LdcA involved in peptidoglycan recycling